MGAKYRRVSKKVKEEMKQIDYWSRLSESDKDYLTQFLLEYYQGDFGYDNPIHPDDLRKDCYSRNNSERRQFHAVGSILKEEQINRSRKPNEYSIRDYKKDILTYSLGDEEVCEESLEELKNYMSR